MIEFHLDRRAGLAPYLQLVQQVEQALRLGLLLPGDQLPTAKSVVSALGINSNTVLKAYRELEHAGLVEVRAGVGTFVQAGTPPAAVPDHPRLRTRLATWMVAARDAGLAAEDVRALVSTTLREVYGAQERSA
ncbi:GntR family transcriptional regulator [Nonomuraea jiangxiensis]|uniref:GntR family transcriptional regulator n=1 Tax=Nonomuraea jiangxiensis TaxID=633440 RepID=UPI000B850C48|nr:GntR family transcriptional regulator [Nonomuraea jiangxiensis]